MLNKMRASSMLLGIVMAGLGVNAQQVVLDASTHMTTINTCSALFVDSGAEGNYNNGEQYVITFCAAQGDECLQAFFQSFQLEANWDFLDVFDGADTQANLIGSYTGTQSPGLITSISGCLTFRFVSDASGTAPGWSASLSCVSCAGFNVAGGGGSAAGCPNIDLGPDFDVDCEDNCTTLTASVLETGQPTEYTVSAIPYEPPFPFNEGTGFSIGTDDVWSPLLTIPFNFCFFGTDYQALTVGSNGLLSFNAAYAGGFCPWSFNQPCPSPQLPLNSVFGVYHDIDPSVCGDAKYAILGEFPCRVFVLNFDNVCHFSCNQLQSTTQVVLYETTNIIEVYVQDKPTCATWNSGNAVIGIQNETGTQGYVAPGRQTGPWSASEEAWRFTPSGAPNFEVNWYDEQNNYLGSGLTLDVCVPPTGASYNAEVIYTSCSGFEIEEFDEINIGIQFDTDIMVQPESCPGNCDAQITVGMLSGSAPFTFDIGDGPQDSGTFTDLCPGVYNITLIDSIGCQTVLTIEIEELDLPLPGEDAEITLCESDAPVNMTDQLGGTPSQFGQWFDADMNPVEAVFNPATDAPGTYTYVVGADPCEASATLEISVNPTLFAEISPDICEGQNFSLPDGTSVNEGGTYEVTIPSVVTECDSVVTVNLTVNPVWAIELDAALCGDGGYTLPDGNEVNEPGTYQVVLTTAEGCDSVITTNLTVISVDAGEYDPICTGQFVVQISGTSSPADPSATLTWSGDEGITFGNETSPSTTASAEEGGAYTIELTDSRCPDDPASALLIMRTPPDAELGTLPELCLGQSGTIQLEVTGDFGSPFVWFDQQGFFEEETGSSLLVNTNVFADMIPLENYEVQVVIPGLDPCPSTSASTTINVIDCDIVIPNVFTPNMDGINSTFQILGIENFPGSKIVIYNRWGHVVYESDSYGNPFWDGRHYKSGVEVSDGVYFYELILSRINKIEKGSVTVFR